MTITKANSVDFTQTISQLDRDTDQEAQKWVRENRKIGPVKALAQSIGAFWKAYFSQKKHKEGVRGLFASVNAGMFIFLSYAKYWELTKVTPKTPPNS